MKTAFCLAAALLASGASAQRPAEGYCAILGVFTGPADAAAFARPLSRTNVPLRMWTDGPGYLVAVGPYGSEGAAAAVLPVLRSRGLIAPNVDGVVTTCPAS